MKQILVILMAFTIVSCAGNTNSVYKNSEIGSSANIYYGVIAGINQVQLEGSDSGIGTVAGAGAGGVLGSMIGGGTRAHVAGAIGGALLGGFLGNQAEKGMTKKTGWQFIIDKDEGGSISVIQSNEYGFKVGDRVMVIQGKETHIQYDDRY